MQSVANGRFLSPETVFRYVNGEATFWGAEAIASFAIASPFTLSMTASYPWGRDELLDEPALGVVPFRGDIALRYEPPEGRFFVEGGLSAIAEQDRVAASRAELATEGYTTADIKAAIEIANGFLLRVGVTNLTDRDYVNHLNAKNPFTPAFELLPAWAQEEVG